MEFVIVAGSSIALFSCLLLLAKRPLTSSETIAVGLLAALVLPMLEKLVLSGTLPLPHLQRAVLSGAPLAFGPLLYLYARSVIEPHRLGAAQTVGHFVPFVGSVAFLALAPPGPPPESFPATSGVPAFDVLGAIVSVVLVGSFLAYTLWIAVKLRHYRQGVKDYFSHDSLDTNLKWLGWITLGFFVAYALAILGELALIPRAAVPTDLSYLRDVGTLFFAVVFGFGAIKQPALFRAENTGPPPKKYERSGLGGQESPVLLARLEVHMRTAQPWLDPELTIENLSAALAVSRHHVTQVINETLGKNFYRFVNEYRIEEVKRKIAEGEADRLSLLGVALDAGFNSKSTFNEAFKSILGTTPSAYRKSVRT